MDALVSAAAVMVSALATDAWQQASVGFWRRAHPDHVPAFESDLDATRAEVIAARGGVDGSADEELVADWQRRLVAADPKVGVQLQRLVDMEIAPLLPTAEWERVRVIQNVIASAPGALAEGAMFGNVVNYGDAALSTELKRPAGADGAETEHL
jgi:hypothetical protein